MPRWCPRSSIQTADDETEAKKLWARWAAYLAERRCTARFLRLRRDRQLKVLVRHGIPCSARPDVRIPPISSPRTQTVRRMRLAVALGSRWDESRIHPRLHSTTNPSTPASANPVRGRCGPQYSISVALSRPTTERTRGCCRRGARAHRSGRFRWCVQQNRSSCQIHSRTCSLQDLRRTFPESPDFNPDSVVGLCSLERLERVLTAFSLRCAPRIPGAIGSRIHHCAPSRLHPSVRPP